jgi:ankyrin repeat protein
MWVEDTPLGPVSQAPFLRGRIAGMADYSSDSAAFIDAIKAGEFERVKAMVSADPGLIDARSRSGESGVLTAVYHRHQDIINLLVARGAALSIFEACAAGELERVERLLDEKTDVNAYSPDGWTALHLAAFFGHTRIAEVLLAHDASAAARSRNPNGNTPLHAALAGNHKLVAGLLIGAGADVNAADAGGWRPLHLAAANNNLDAMKALIAQGADVLSVNGEGKTPLSIALEKNQREAAALLKRHGA